MQHRDEADIHTVHTTYMMEIDENGEDIYKVLYKNTRDKCTKSVEWLAERRNKKKNEVGNWKLAVEEEVEEEGHMKEIGRAHV